MANERCCASLLPLDAYHGQQARDLARQPGLLGGFHHGGDVLVGTGRLLGDPFAGMAAHQRALPAQFLDDAVAPELLGRLLAREDAACAVQRAAKGLCLGLLRPGQNPRM